MGILERSYIALGLIQNQIYLLLALHLRVVELNLIGRTHLGAELGHYLTIYSYKTCRNKVIRLTT